MRIFKIMESLETTIPLKAIPSGLKLPTELLLSETYRLPKTSLSGKEVFGTQTLERLLEATLQYTILHHRHSQATHLLESYSLCSSESKLVPNPHQSVFSLGPLSLTHQQLLSFSKVAAKKDEECKSIRKKRNKIPLNHDEYLQMQKLMEKKGELDKESLERGVIMGRGRKGDNGRVAMIKAHLMLL